MSPPPGTTRMMTPGSFSLTSSAMPVNMVYQTPPKPPTVAEYVWAEAPPAAKASTHTIARIPTPQCFMALPPCPSLPALSCLGLTPPCSPIRTFRLRRRQASEQAGKGCDVRGAVDLSHGRGDPFGVRESRHRRGQLQVLGVDLLGGERILHRPPRVLDATRERPLVGCGDFDDGCVPLWVRGVQLGVGHHTGGSPEARDFRVPQAILED